jgi:hypothetical protein
MSQTKVLAIVTIVLALLLAGSVTLILKQVAVNRGLQTQVAHLRSTTDNLRAQAARATAQEAELSHLRADRRELLKLRGELARLRGKPQEAPTATEAQAASPTPEPQAETPPLMPAGPFTAALNTRVPAGQTLIAGGWATGNGKRTYVLMTPDLSEDSEGQAVFDQLGLGQLKAASAQSSVQGLLSEEQMDALEAGMEQGANVDILAAPRIITADGQQASVRVGGMANVDGKQVETGTTINVIPRIADDASGTEMAVTVRYNPSPARVK